MLWVSHESSSHRAKEKDSLNSKGHSFSPYPPPLLPLLLFFFSFSSLNNAPLQREDCVLVSGYVPSLNYAHECLRMPSGKESQCMKTKCSQGHLEEGEK